MSFFEFPHTRTYDNDLGWLIAHVIRISKQLENFINLNTIKYADPIAWNITTQYEANTVVIDPSDGTAYISTRPVPSGVLISNTDYWTPIFNYGESMDTLREQIAAANEKDSMTATAARSAGELVWINGNLYRVLYDIAAGTQYIIGTNIEPVTVEMILEALRSATEYNRSKIAAIIHKDVAEMIADTSLEIDDKTCTLYHTTQSNGGGALYIITEDTPNGFDRIALANGLTATLVIPPELDISAFGAIAGEDVTDILRAAISYAAGPRIPLYVKAKNYVISDTITIDAPGLVIRGEVTSPLSDNRRDWHFIFNKENSVLFNIQETGDNGRFVNLYLTTTGTEAAPISDAIVTTSFRWTFRDLVIYKFSGGLGFRDRNAWAGENIVDGCMFYHNTYHITTRRGTSTAPTDNVIRNCIFKHGRFSLSANHLDGWLYEGNHDYSLEGVYASGVRNSVFTGNYFDYAKDNCCLHLVGDSQCDTVITGNAFLSEGSVNVRNMIWLEGGNTGHFTITGNGMMSYSTNYTNLYLVLARGPMVTVSGNGVVNNQLFSPTSFKARILGHLLTSVYEYRFKLEESTSQTFTFPVDFSFVPVLLGATLGGHDVSKISGITSIDITPTTITINKSSAGLFSGQWFTFVVAAGELFDSF